jgi:hypothetical protein
MLTGVFFVSYFYCTGLSELIRQRYVYDSKADDLVWGLTREFARKVKGFIFGGSMLKIREDMGFGFHGLLALDQPHEPAGCDGSADEQDKAEGAEADHQARFRSLGDPEDD